MSERTKKMKDKDVGLEHWITETDIRVSWQAVSFSEAQTSVRTDNMQDLMVSTSWYNSQRNCPYWTSSTWFTYCGNKIAFLLSNKNTIHRAFSGPCSGLHSWMSKKLKHGAQNWHFNLHQSAEHVYNAMPLFNGYCHHSPVRLHNFSAIASAHASLLLLKFSAKLIGNWYSIIIINYRPTALGLVRRFMPLVIILHRRLKNLFCHALVMVADWSEGSSWNANCAGSYPLWDD